jgi:hypothetical protein
MSVPPRRPSFIAMRTSYPPFCVVADVAAIGLPLLAGWVL